MNKLSVRLQTRFCSLDRRPHKRVAIALLVLMGLIAASCGPSQSELNAQSTLSAASDLSTAFAPTLTPTLTSLPTATPIPSLTPTPLPTQTTVPTITSTPTLKPTITSTPDAVIVGSLMLVHDGPGTAYAQLGHFTKNEGVTILGEYENCLWLKLKSVQHPLTGWISGSKQYVKYQTSCADIPVGTFRPPTSLLLSYQKGGGYGTLNINNGTNEDGVVFLTIGQSPSKSAYIRAGESFLMQGIRDQTYNLYFMKGSDWDGKEFLTNPSYHHFQDSLTYATKYTQTAVIYHTWSVTLQGVIGGTGKVDDVGGSNFPGLGN
ncbi:MAG: SH3 domain-containing protein [Anaerolineaceae bacterium]|nr:SH3 domain-containing protein [Anaerolineaceae bacterium]